MKKLSIVIVSYNTKKLTIECIKSILHNPPGTSYEIIVSDNGSTDGSLEALKKLGNKIICIDNKENLGFAKANNNAVARSSGEYLLLLNSDTIVPKGTLTKILEFAENTLNAGVVAPRLVNSDGTLQPSIYRLPTISLAIQQYWLKRGNPLDKYGISNRSPQKVDAVVGAAFLITPQARKKVGLLNEKYFMYFEDLDYCREVHKHNLDVFYLPEVYVTHIHGASGKGKVNNLLIESSKKYFGIIRYWIYTFVLWSGQKIRYT